LHTTAAEAVIADDANMAAPAVAPRRTFITDVIIRTSLFAVPNQRHSVTVVPMEQRLNFQVPWRNGERWDALSGCP
jgi:hypothetical protein